MATLSELGTYAKLSTGRPGRAMIDTFESRRQGGPQGRAHIREVSAGAERGLREMLGALCVALIDYSKHTREYRPRRPPWLTGWVLKIVEFGLLTAAGGLSRENATTRHYTIKCRIVRWDT